MLSIAHGPTGAFIASKIPNPFVSAPLAVLAHLLEDRVPHWDVGRGMNHGLKTKKQAFLEELFFDFPLSILLTYLFFQVGKPFDWHIWLGWFCGLLPDFLEFPSNFMNLHFKPLDDFKKIHEFFHVSTEHIAWGLIPQLLVIFTIYLLR